MEPFVGQIDFFGGNFAPRGYAKCDGALLAISNNDALFSLLGTIYGGDGRTTFGLPELRGRMAVHQGQGPGLPFVQIGRRSGTETVTLTANNVPSHTHSARLRLGAGGGNQGLGTNRHLAADSLVDLIFTDADATDKALATGSVEIPASGGGSSIAFSILPPQLGVTAIIALFGLYPSRN